RSDCPNRRDDSLNFPDARRVRADHPVHFPTCIERSSPVSTFAPLGAIIRRMASDLFSQAHEERLEREAPLAARMRPRTLDEYIGQDHIVGPGRLLRRAIQADQLGSLIFYGPPGTGKTTLAQVIANTTRAHFIALNAVLSGVKEIREA